MNAPRWQQVEELYHAALARPAESRAAYLAQACASDPDLLREVQSLLANDGTGPLDRPAWQGTDSLLQDKPLPTGSQLGPYEITGILGQGGMGRVYSARDNRLGRSVAIKFATGDFGERFRQEARAVAALNHPNICTLHDVGPNYLVMELLEGDTLADRIRQGPLPQAEALAIARQIADALEAAHEQGIVHRDLKPANIKIKPDGSVKVIDFGLAKAQIVATGNPEDSPTLTLATQPGTIMGTAAYMAPEQARGKAVDKRADIWAFGVVVYELLTGKRLFAGETVSDILAQTLTKPIDFAAVPLPSRRLLERCLVREPRQRLRDIGDARLLLEPESEVPPPAAGRPLAPWLVAGLATLLAAGAGFVAFRKPATPIPPVTRLNIPVPYEALRGFSVSPNGRMLAYAALSQRKSMIWVRALDGGEAQVRPGTEDGLFPFWSPDSQSIGFFAGNQLKRMEAAGGSPQVVCEGVNGQPVGAAWSTGGTIIFTINSTGGLQSVPAAGGTPTRLTQPNAAEVGHKWPSFLADGRRFLYFAEDRKGRPGKVYASSLDRPRERVAILETIRSAVLVPGYLLHSPHGELVAQRFDEAALRLEGQPMRLADQVENASALELEAAASSNGILAYSRYAAGTWQLSWAGRKGKMISTMGAPDIHMYLRLSPDGRKFVVGRNPLNAWVYDLTRDTFTKITQEISFFPQWSADGEWLVFASYTNEGRNLFRKRVNDAGESERLTFDPTEQTPSGLSRDGRFVFYSVLDPASNHDLWMLPMAGERKPRLLRKTKFGERDAVASPDGRLLAYTSDESGRNEVYIQEFAGESGLGSRRWQASTKGGSFPRWSRDGQELIYLSDTHLMALPVAPTGIGVPQELFPYTERYFDVAADGQRFLVRRPLETPAELTVITNWLGLLGK